MPDESNSQLKNGQPVRAFLTVYRRALAMRDVDSLVSFYRLPLPVIRPDRFRIVDNKADLREQLTHIVDFYGWAGMREVEMRDLRIDGFGDGLDLATLTWAPRDASGEAITQVDVTFAIRCAAAGPRIAAVIAHNEERRRQPILRESLAILGASE